MPSPSEQSDKSQNLSISSAKDFPDKSSHLSKIFSTISNRTIIIALDDSSISGPENGLRDMEGAIRVAATQKANAIMGFPGIFKNYNSLTNGIAGVLNLTLSTSGPGHLRKTLVGKAQQVQDLGLDAASVHVNLTSKYEHEMLNILGMTSIACQELGVPLLAHMYPRTIKNGKEYHYQDLRDNDPDKYARLVRHGARIAADLGADLIKVPYTGTVKSFTTVVDSTYGLPVIMAGGPKMEISEFLNLTHAALKAGAKGIAVGRNFFQQDSHHQAGLALTAMRYVVHDGLTPTDAIEKTGLAKVKIPSSLGFH